ncbi:hypothetical protein HAX54_029512 [Datura stramonium]|uniref:Uncharacterized protein n=1 Tax=Datura stramonium TaxID=4076 RepID=A0ABS8V877_DATST|nr:hypothetical protein [Datura stramonium]
MSAYHKLLFGFVMKNLIPHQERRDAASFLDLTLMGLLDRIMKINLPSLMIDYLSKVLLKNERLRLENAGLRSQLVRNDEASTARHNDLVNLIRGLFQTANPSSYPTV